VGAAEKDRKPSAVSILRCMHVPNFHAKATGGKYSNSGQPHFSAAHIFNFWCSMAGTGALTKQTVLPCPPMKRAKLNACMHAAAPSAQYARMQRCTQHFELVLGSIDCKESHSPQARQETTAWDSTCKHQSSLLLGVSIPVSCCWGMPHQVVERHPCHWDDSVLHRFNGYPSMRLICMVN